MECQICSSKYTSNKKPKALPVCEHNYCLNCIVSLTVKGEGSFKCPACQQEFALAPPYTLDSIDSQLLSLGVSDPTIDQEHYIEPELESKSNSSLNETSQRIKENNDYSNASIEAQVFEREDNKLMNNNKSQIDIEKVEKHNEGQEENDDYLENEIIIDEDLQEDPSEDYESNDNKVEEDNDELEQIGKNHELNSESLGMGNDNQELDIENDCDYVEDSNAEGNEEYEDLEIDGGIEEVYEGEIGSEVYEDFKQNVVYEQYEKQLSPVVVIQSNGNKEWQDTHKKNFNEPVHAFDLNIPKKEINIDEEHETTSKACCNFCYII